MRKTVTTYVCDGCGKKVDSVKDLRSFTLVMNRRGKGWIFGDDGWADLCNECEGRIIAAVEPILGSGIVELRREQEDEKPKRKGPASRNAERNPR